MANRQIDLSASQAIEKHIDGLFWDLNELQEESGITDEMWNIVYDYAGSDIAGWWSEYVHDERTRRMR